MKTMGLLAGMSWESSSVYYQLINHQVQQRLAADQSTLIRPGDVVRVDTTIFWDAIQMISPLTGFAAIAGTRY